jgi:PKD repeat protein
MILKQLLFITLLLSSITFYSQQIDKANFCAHNKDIYEELARNPQFQNTLDAIKVVQKNHLEEYKRTTANNRARTVYYIPIVYHIIHQGGPENISDAQVHDDLAQLNEMFRKQNPSVNNVKSNFKGITADIEIEFRLAQKKDDGSCFSGITRTNSITTSGASGGARINVIRNAHGDFPGDKYLNVFVADEIGGAAGYTIQPISGFTSMENGIHILHTYIGRFGTSIQTGENATLAHEVGHWLNLDHVWGGSNSPGVASNCNIDDGIGDTPNTIGWSSCDTNGVTCSTLDNVQNIMEYSYCGQNMFTNGQDAFMRAAITSPVGGRNNVISAPNHAATGIFSDVLCQANFSTEITMTCEDYPIQFSDNSYHNATSWNWSFPGGTPSTSNVKNPIITYSTTGIYDVSLTVTNASGTLSVFKANYMYVLGKFGLQTYSEGFENPSNLNDNWFPRVVSGTKNWAITNTAAKGGSNSVMVENFNSTLGATSELYSETVYLSDKSSVSLSFDYAYARKTAPSSERVQVYFTNDCGENWTLVRSLFVTVPNTNSFFVPSNGNWSSQSINIGAQYLVSDFRFKIVLINDNGNNVYFDNININSVVGINEITELNNFNIYPNPFNERATIELNLNKDAEVSIQLVDVLGKKVRQIASKTKLGGSINHKFEIQKNNLNTGLYFVKTTVNGNIQLKRILIN